jgi:dolichyl-phosphate-mannose--protein O-mannosyl transferase
MLNKYPWLQKPSSWLVLILLVCTFSRFWNLGYLREYVFDEVYHGFTAKMYALDRYETWVWWTTPPEGVAYEWTHPPLAKVIMAWGIDMFGGPGELPTKVTRPDYEQSTEEKEAEKNTTKVLANNSFGWRFFSAVFGVLATWGIYLFAGSIFKNKWIGVLSAFLFTFDLLPLVQSRIAMNDIFAVTFMMFAFYFFTKRENLLDYRLSWKNWLLSGVFIGCAVASKWTPLFALIIMGIYQLATVLYALILRHKISILKLVGQVGYLAFCLGIIPLVIYLLSYWQLFTLPIDDYKGNSLKEAVESNRWQQDIKNVNDRLKLAVEGKCTEVYAAEFCDVKKLRAEVKDYENKENVFGRMYKINPYLADRLYIWWGLQQQMWWYHTNLKATHAYTSQWWSWPLDIRPVWFYVKYCNTGSSEQMCKDYYQNNKNGKNSIADVYTMGNPLIFWLIFAVVGYVGYKTTGNYRKWFYALIPAILILLLQYNFTLDRSKLAADGNIPSVSDSISAGMAAVVPQVMLFGMLLLLFLTVINLLDYLFSKEPERKEKFPKAFMPLVLTLFLFCALWLPWARSPRIMFFYHFFPPMTFFYPLFAYVLYKLYMRGGQWRTGVISYLCLVVFFFVYFYPHVTGVLLPENIRESYFWLKSWK